MRTTSNTSCDLAPTSTWTRCTVVAATTAAVATVTALLQRPRSRPIWTAITCPAIITFRTRLSCLIRVTPVTRIDLTRTRQLIRPITRCLHTPILPRQIHIRFPQLSRSRVRHLDTLVFRRPLGTHPTATWKQHWLFFMPSSVWPPISSF